MKEKKTERYYTLLDQFQAGLPEYWFVLWKIERESEMNSFSILAYSIGSKVVLVQNFYNGAGLFIYLPDSSLTFEEIHKNISKLIKEP